MWRNKKYHFICIIAVLIVTTVAYAVESKQINKNSIRENINIIDEIKNDSFVRIYIVKETEIGIFSSIKKAIKRADEGDTIFVKKGIYRENIIIDKSIRLIGENKNNTKIIGNGLGNVISCIADDITISGFTIQNSGKDYFDSGIEVNAHNSIIIDNIITQNYIGINLYFSSNTTITNNHIYCNKGNGIKTYECDQNILSFNILDENDRGITVSHSPENIISYNKISAHKSDSLWLYHSDKNTIRDNTIIESEYGGMSLSHSPDNMIFNNIVMDTSQGIHIHNSSNSIISGNSILDGRHRGIDISASSEITISENIIKNIRGDGVMLRNASNNHITDNTIQENRGYSVVLMYSSKNNSISGNMLYFNHHGLKLDCSPYNTIIDNVFSSTGITFVGTEKIHWSSHTIKRNELNDQIIQYYVNSKSIPITSNTAQIILVNCSDFIISNLNLSQVDSGIQLYFSSQNHIINNNINSERYGIYLYQSTHNILGKNTISSNSHAGIYLMNSTENKLSSNHIQDSQYGIELEEAQHNIIQSNSLSRNNIGIYLYNSLKNTCNKNLISTNKNSGISLQSSSNNSFVNNTLINNINGFNLKYSKRNVFFENSITKDNKNHFGFYFVYTTDYDNTISSTNTINGNPVHWYTHTDNIRIEDIKLNEKRMTNVAQVMFFDCNNIICSDIQIKNTTEGVKIFSSQNIFLSGLIIVNVSNALELYGSTDIEISGCLIKSSYDALLLDTSSNAILSNITLIENRVDGINLIYSTYITVQQSMINGNFGYGVYIDRSSHIILQNNTLFDNQVEGLNIHYSTDIAIIDNKFKSTGIILEGYENEHWNSHTIIKNQIDNGSICYYYQQSNIIVPPDTAQLILVNCTESTISHLNFSAVNVGIQLAFSSQIVIKENFVRCIDLYHSPNNIIQNNTITHSNEFGIYLSRNSDQNLVTQNRITNHQGSGIIVYLSSGNSIIDNCIMQNDNSGIFLHISSNNTISNNQITQNYHGIKLNNNANLNKIQENAITDNIHSLIFSDSSKNQIENNNILNNEIRPEQIFWVNSYTGEKWSPSQARNYFNHNYWDRFRLLPKILPAELWIHTHDHFGGNYLLPWFFFDWNPAKKAFTI